MKKQGILNAQLSRIIASLGHTDQLAVGDCGLPIPPQIEVVDLAVVIGLPRFIPVVEALAKELVIQKVIIAEETFGRNLEVYTFLQNQFKGLNFEAIPHETFKTILPKTRAIIRTGEATPYANVILESGVPF